MEAQYAVTGLFGSDELQLLFIIGELPAPNRVICFTFQWVKLLKEEKNDNNKSIKYSRQQLAVEGTPGLDMPEII